MLSCSSVHASLVGIFRRSRAERPSQETASPEIRLIVCGIKGTFDVAAWCDCCLQAFYKVQLACVVPGCYDIPSICVL